MALLNTEGTLKKLIFSNGVWYEHASRGAVWVSLFLMEANFGSGAPQADANQM